MKIIELLNKIANGEEVPKKFIWDDNEYYLQSNKCYKCDETLTIFEEDFILENLNDEIEIIEEKKIPEKLILHTLSNNDSADFKTLQDFNNRDIQRTINWILDYLKSKGE